MAGSKASTDRPLLTVEHVKELFRRVSASEIEDATLIGGQATAFWAVYYKVASAVQMTTKDIDLLADRTAAARFASSYKVRLNEAKTPRVPDFAFIDVVVGNIPVRVDFLRSVHGLDATEVMSTRLSLQTQDMDVPIHIMHPMLCMASRLFNTYQLPGRYTLEEKERLRCSLQALKAYLIDLARHPDKDERSGRALSTIAERVFLISLTDAGSMAWYRDKIDVFQSIPAPSDAVSYPKKFASLRYPQMLKKLAARRADFIAFERKREKLLKTAAGARQK
ncbi:MAG: hypothetical protein ACLQU2_09710 [Candidatus Binataceae bacterium]